MAIALTDLLDEKQVILGLRSRKVANALREMIELLAQSGKIQNPQGFFEKVLAREEAHPSVVENGIAFPHARTDLVDELVVGISAEADDGRLRRSRRRPAGQCEQDGV